MSRCLIILLVLAGMSFSITSFADKNAKQPVSTSIKSSNEVVLPANSPQLNYLKVEVVKEIPTPTTEPLNGKIVFDENHTSRISTSINGRVTKIYVQIGDIVKAGQVLMVIDAPELGSSLAEARKAQADLQFKKSAMARSKMLFDGGVIAKKELESAESDLASAEAESTRANDKLKNLGTSNKVIGEGYAVRAPIGGVIVDRQVNPGALVRSDAPNPIFIITDPGKLWASIDLPERNLSKVTINQKLTIQVDAYSNEVFDGQVLSIGEMVDPATRKITVRSTVDGKGKLKPEMYAKITLLSAGSEKVIRLPNSALITEGLYSYVFVETSVGHISKRKVELGSQSLDFSIVKKGLKSGEHVVTAGAILLNSELSSGH